eukprot:11844774-Prorocentrum_lima.AAC.1
MRSKVCVSTFVFPVMFLEGFEEEDSFGICGSTFDADVQGDEARQLRIEAAVDALDGCAVLLEHAPNLP